MPKAVNATGSQPAASSNNARPTRGSDERMAVVAQAIGEQNSLSSVDVLAQLDQAIETYRIEQQFADTPEPPNRQKLATVDRQCQGKLASPFQPPTDRAAQRKKTSGARRLLDIFSTVANNETPADSKVSPPRRADIRGRKNGQGCSSNESRGAHVSEMIGGLREHELSELLEAHENGQMDNYCKEKWGL